jgi:hypothetical protein
MKLKVGMRVVVVSADEVFRTSLETVEGKRGKITQVGDLVCIVELDHPLENDHRWVIATRSLVPEAAEVLLQ